MFWTFIIMTACVAAAVALVTFIRDLTRGAAPGKVLARAGREASVVATCFLIGGASAWLAAKGLIAARTPGFINLAVATAIGLAVTGVYLSFGQTRWRSALCGAGTVACFLNILALVKSVGA